MEKKIAVIATMDTKAAEALYIRECIVSSGYPAFIVDVSTKRNAHYDECIDSETVARYGGATLDDLHSFRRDDMMRTMGEGAGALLQSLHSEGKLGGALGIGGNQGTAISAIAMRKLPTGTPKLIVSTVASGNVRPYVEYKDLMMMFSVVDFLGGPNDISRSILANAAGALVGMCRFGQPVTHSKAPAIGITAFGNTDAAASLAIKLLQEKGYEVFPFHASGAGGAAMEELIEMGYIQGVLDLTTHELLGEVWQAGIYIPLRPRLCEAGKKGIPQVVVPGALEYFCFREPSSIPEKFLDRKTHYHNPYNTNIRATAEEVTKAAKVMAEKLNASSGPVVVVIPLKSFSDNGREGFPLREPETDLILMNTLKANLDHRIKVIEIDSNINDPEFATAAVEAISELMPL